MASTFTSYMPMQLYLETKEYLKVIELMLRYMKAGHGNPYLKKKAPSRPRQDSAAQGGGPPIAQPPASLPEQFESKEKLAEFMVFFGSYMRKTNRVIELCLRVGALDQSGFGSSGESASFKYFRIRYKKTLQKCIQRVYKSIMVLFKLFPESRLSHFASQPQNLPPHGSSPSKFELSLAPPSPSQWDESIFDKIYLIQLLLQSLNKRQHKRYLARVEAAGNKGGFHEYEQITKSIIEKGGVKSLTVTEISETSKKIKEKMDIELREIIASFDFTADFFITSHSLRKLWQRCFQPRQYRVEVDLFVAAFDESVCKDILTSSESTHLDGQRRKTFSWLFNVE